MKMIDLFAGIAGFSLAGHSLGWETIAFVEWDDFNQKVIKKNFPGIPVFGDIRKFNSKKYNGKTDIVCGGFPCQPFSAAGKRKGKDDDRHLWPEMLRVVRESKPTWVIGENVAGIASMGYGPTLLETLLAKVASVTHLVGPYYNHVVNKREIGILNEICEDLEKEGYKVQSFRIPACAVGAPHRRDRMWIVAHSDSRAKGSSRASKKPDSQRCHDISKSKKRRKQTQFYTGWDHVLQSIANAKGRGAGESINGDKEERRVSGVPSQSDLCNELASNSKISNDRQFIREQKIGSEQQPRKYVEQRTTTDTSSKGLQSSQLNEASQEGWKEESFITVTQQNKTGWGRHWFSAATLLCRVDDGLSPRVDRHRRSRLKSLGNAIVPQVAFEIFKAIEEFEKNNI